MKKTIIENYFQAWLDVDIKTVERTFSNDSVYSECYGPEYHGIQEILQWFKEWNEKGRVLEWQIKRIIEQGNTVVAEWHFKCEYEDELSEFNGVTIADFDERMQITRLLEFESKSEHYYPYAK